MNEIRNFLFGSMGTLGVMEMADTQLLSPEGADPKDMLIRSVITLIAGVLTTLVSRWLKKQKANNTNETNALEEKGPKVKNIFKIKNRKNK